VVGCFAAALLPTLWVDQSVAEGAAAQSIEKELMLPQCHEVFSRVLHTPKHISLISK